MKALSIKQPQATMIAIGVKKIETRSWATQYRGPLAIHASKGFTRETREIAELWAIRHGFKVDELPLGAIVATCNLTGCCSTSGALNSDDCRNGYGDFSAGRWAWFLDSVVQIDPISVKGHLGLWKWEQLEMVL